VDTPITEMGFGGLAVGAALAGLRPMYVFGVYLRILLLMDIIHSQMRVHDFQLRHASN